jgi:hypothetical protein
MIGEQTNYVWGVLDMKPLTNFVRLSSFLPFLPFRLFLLSSVPPFPPTADILPRLQPDIRSRCAVHSASAGSIMVIPQERDLVRLYIQLPIQVKPGERLPKDKVTPESILEVARNILHPYTLETEHIDWFTGSLAYSCSSFLVPTTDDVILKQATTSANVLPSLLASTTVSSSPEMLATLILVRLDSSFPLFSVSFSR